MAMARRHRRTLDIWPGFVDALATILIVLLFVLMVFVLAQFFLSQALFGRNQVVEQLSAQLATLTDELTLQTERAEQMELRIISLSDELNEAYQRLQTVEQERDQAFDDLLTAQERAQSAEETREATAEELSETQRQMALLQNDIAALQALKADLEAEIEAMDAKLSDTEGRLADQRRISEEARTQAALLNQQLAALREELRRVGALLAESEARSEAQEAQIADLGRKLNRALAERVSELSQYRSEFFGRLREVLADKPGIRVEGDRFVFQSEVLFESGSADIGAEGLAQLDAFASTLIEVASEIPESVDWILRVDGHTDPVPISNEAFDNNWELSTGRATSVVEYLISRGIAPERLAATGFASFQPLDPRRTAAANRRNRRIEFKLTQP